MEAWAKKHLEGIAEQIAKVDTPELWQVFGETLADTGELSAAAAAVSEWVAILEPRLQRERKAAMIELAAAVLEGTEREEEFRTWLDHVDESDKEAAIIGFLREA